MKNINRLLKNELGSELLGEALAMFSNEQSNKENLYYRQLIEKFKNGDLIPFGQKIYTKTGGRLKSIEILSRAKINGELVFPDVFIQPIMEANLGVELDKIVIERSVNELKNSRFLTPNTPISVNLTVKSILDESMLEFLKDIKREYLIFPEQLILEITEMEEILDFDVLSDAMLEFISIGYSFSIDDFGDGYSSMKAIANLPVKEVKIDKSYILDMPESPKRIHFISTVVEMLAKNGVLVTIEGVETEKHLKILQKMNINGLQGFHLHKPQPLIEITPI